MNSNQVLRLPKVKALTGFGRSTIYAEMGKGNFPAAIKLTEEGRSVGWLSEEVDAWLTKRIEASRTKRGVK